MDISVFGYENKEKHSIYVSKKSEEKHVDLLLIGEEGKRHYFIIKDFNTFMYDYTLHRGRKRFCCYCLQAFSLLKSAPQLVSFCLGSTFNTLASPQNRACWGLEDGLECGLCGKEKASVSHILAGCQKALQSGRYTYCHNVVLRGIAHKIQAFINKIKKEEQKVAKDRILNFVKEGEQCKRSTKKVDKLGILHEAKDWVMETDLDQQLLFPEIICSSTQRPDIVIYSVKLKKVIVVELTCPAEENIEERHSEKLGRYEILRKDCISTGWKVHLFAIEVGVRGYAACSLRTCLSKLGFTHRSVRDAHFGSGLKEKMMSRIIIKEGSRSQRTDRIMSAQMERKTQ